MFLFIDNYDSFSWNLVQAFYALGRKPVVHANDDPRILELATSPGWKPCAFPGPSHPRNAGLCLEFLKRLPLPFPCWACAWGTSFWATSPGRRFPALRMSCTARVPTSSMTALGCFPGFPIP